MINWHGSVGAACSDPQEEFSVEANATEEERFHHGGMLMFNDQLLALLEEINVSLNYE